MKPRYHQEINITIQRLGIHGEGVGYWHGYTVFVDGALPGETIQARIIERKKNYGRGSLINIENPSPSRVTPRCPHFDQCGGCQLMHLEYSSQLEMKRQRVVDAFERIGKCKDLNILPCRPSPSPYGYRNKVQVPSRPSEEGIALGFYSRNSHNLVEIDGCHIHNPLGEEVFQEVKKILKKSEVIAYDWKTLEGELRFVIVKTAVNTQQALVLLVTNGNGSPSLHKAAKQILDRIPAVRGVVQNVNTIPENVVLSDEYHLLEGKPYIEEKICEMTFKVSSASFFQVNPAQAEHLYTTAIRYAGLSGKETVLDAFCGVGTLSLLVSRQAKQVIGIECVPQAIEDAKENANRNDVTNVSFICDFAESWMQGNEPFDVALLNPPRKGCEPMLLAGIGRRRPHRIVYVSCDPATLARDVAQLKEYGYHICEVQPFDMFPQTAHVETVVKLEYQSTN